MATVKAQDMPPQGGYAKIPFKRVPARTLFNGYQLIAAYLAMTAGSGYIMYLTRQQMKREEIEMRSAKLALAPLLIAERDREYLKQVRINRDEEAKIMKDVPGWVVGTWYGEPIFKTKPKDYLFEGSWDDLNTHASLKNTLVRTNFHLWN